MDRMVRRYAFVTWLASSICCVGYACGCSLTRVDQENETARAQAETCPDEEDVQRVLDELMPEDAAVREYGLLLDAIQRQDTDQLDELLRRGYDPAHVADDRVGPLLPIAAGTGNVTTVRMLLAAGADVNEGCPLAYAALSGSIDVMNVLLASGADVNAAPAGMVTPSVLLMICEHGLDGDMKMLDMLVAAGLALNEYDRRHIPLHYASFWGQSLVVEYLIQNGAGIGAVDYRGRTALHDAAFGGREKVVRLLLDNGADPAAVDLDGMTPGDLARQRGHVILLPLLQP